MNEGLSDIQWNPPAPRAGLLGAWDKFVGPGATRGEERLQVVGTLVLTTALMALLILRHNALAWSTAQWIVSALLAFDLLGGVITNATSAAKRWYHRSGQQGLRGHLPFVAVHGLHLVLVAALFRGMDWIYVVVAYSYLMVAAGVIVRTQLHLRRPMAMALWCGGLLIGLYILVPASGLEWFLPLFYLKLLVSHLVKEAPFAAKNL
ncbi:MAG: hypothetical protein IPK19_04175 [Chloroflexi bacterium]|nr:hypothetical protein [Chloroflexota bacterium]